MERRNFIQTLLPAAALLAAMPVDAFNNKAITVLSDDDVLKMYPDNIQQLIKNIVTADYKKVNPDWDGTIKMEALLGVGPASIKQAMSMSITGFITEWKMISS